MASDPSQKKKRKTAGELTDPDNPFSQFTPAHFPADVGTNPGLRYHIGGQSYTDPMANLAWREQLKRLDEQEAKHVASFHSVCREYKDVIEEQDEQMRLAKSKIARLEAIITEHAKYEGPEAVSLAQEGQKFKAKMAELQLVVAAKDAKIEELGVDVEKATYARHTTCRQEIDQLKAELVAEKMRAGGGAAWEAIVERSEAQLRKDKAVLEKQINGFKKQIVVLQDRNEELESSEAAENFDELKRLAKEAVEDLDHATMMEWGETGQKLLRLAEFTNQL